MSLTSVQLHLAAIFVFWRMGLMLMNNGFSILLCLYGAFGWSVYLYLSMIGCAHEISFAFACSRQVLTNYGESGTGLGITAGAAPIGDLYMWQEMETALYLSCSPLCRHRSCCIF